MTLEPDPRVDEERQRLAFGLLFERWPCARSADAYRQHERYPLALPVGCWGVRFLRAWNEAGARLGRRTRA